MKTKVTFIHEGILFEDIEVRTWNNGTSYYITGRGLSKVVKKYFKAKHNLKVKTKYSCFSGGDCLRVIADSGKDLMQELSEKFQHGSYDYHTDCQTYKSCSFDSVSLTDQEGNQRNLSATVKYTHFELAK